MGAISGNGEIDSSILDLAARLKKLGFTGEGKGAVDLLRYIGLPTTMSVDDLNRWTQGRLALVAAGLSWEEGSCEVEVTPELTAAALGLALLSNEGTEAMINRVRRGIDV